MRRMVAGAALGAAALLVGCQRGGLDAGGMQPTRLEVELRACQTAPGLGSGQGVEVRDGFVYLFGDADTGVVRQYRFDRRLERLRDTGRQVRLTKDGEDLIAHPTGLTHHPDYGTFIGDTVGGVGTIYRVDWRRLWRDGDLDHAVLNVVADDLAINGTRPEFVLVEQGDAQRWLIATSDYGAAGNEVRLYDPERLATAKRTSDEGVLVGRMRCGPWVQSLHWLAEARRLALVQNQIAGLRWRLTDAPLIDSDLTRFGPYDFDEPGDELEGFHLLGAPCGDDAEWAVWLTSSRLRNVWLGAVRVE